MHRTHMYDAVGPCGRIVLEVGDWRRFEDSRTGRLRPRVRDPRAANRGAVRPLRIGICIAALGWHGDIRAIALIERLPLAGAGLVRVGGAGALGGSSGRWSGPGSVGRDMRSYSSRRPHRGDPLVLVHALALGPRDCQCSRLALRSSLPGGSDLLVFWHGEGQTALNAAESVHLTAKCDGYPLYSIRNVSHFSL